MKTNRIVVRFVAGGGILLFGLLLFIASRSFSYHSLTVDVLGSYFPAWMVCIMSGVTLTLIAHSIVELCNLKPYVGPAPVIYSSLTIIFTFATWILFYQN